MKPATRNKFVDALERLIEGKPDNRELRLKAKEGKLKINDSTVEQEAGLSVGSLRNHGDIKDMVKAKSLTNRVEQSESAQSSIELLEEEVKKLKKDRTQANKKKTEYHKLAKSHKTALAAQASSHIKMVQELMEMIPVYERERAMDNIVRTRPGNVIDGKFR
jgi:hypothetical protein